MSTQPIPPAARVPKKPLRAFQGLVGRETPTVEKRKHRRVATRLRPRAG